MSKTILLLTLLGTATLFVLSIIDPNNSIMWLASTDAKYQALRIIMILILATLLATHPPRHTWLRLLVGFFAVAVSVWAFTQTYFWAMNVLDLMSILSFGLITGVTVLETDVLSLTASDDERIQKAHKARMTIMQPSIFNSRR